MALFKFLRKSRRSDDDVGGPPNSAHDFWYKLAEKMRGGTGGQWVTATTAQRIAAVYACQTAIAESFAMLPAMVYDESDERKKEKMPDHPLSGLLRNRPNPIMDPFNYKEAMEQNVLDTGNAYSHIQRDGGGRGSLKALTPIVSEQMTPKVRLESGALRIDYEHRQPDGTLVTYPQEEIFHLRYKTKDGIMGRSPITVAAQVFGFGLALQQHGNNVFENGAFLSGFIKTPFTFKDDEARKSFMASFRAIFGANQSGKAGLLEQGTEWVPHAMNLKDAQFLEARNFSVEEIARIYRVPPILIQMTKAGMSYASVEQLAQFFVTYTIQPWATRWEYALKNQLLTGPGEENMFVRFNMGALLRGDLLAQTTAIVQRLQYGLSTINEGRNKLDEPAVDDKIADRILLSHNLLPAEKALESTQTPALAPVPQDEQPVEPDEEEPAPAKKPDKKKSAAFEPLFRELLGRITRRTSTEMKARAKKPAADREATDPVWRKEHRQFVVDTLRPACFAFLGAESDTAEKLAARYELQREIDDQAVDYLLPDFLKILEGAEHA